jgi:hypothetical protein
MKQTYTFKRVAITGFLIRIASRRTDYPFVGYYGKDGTIVTDYNSAQTYQNMAAADAAIPVVKALLTGDMANACKAEVTNKVVIAQAT